MEDFKVSINGEGVNDRLEELMDNIESIRFSLTLSPSVSSINNENKWSDEITQTFIEPLPRLSRKLGLLIEDFELGIVDRDSLSENEKEVQSRLISLHQDLLNRSDLVLKAITNDMTDLPVYGKSGSSEDRKSGDKCLFLVRSVCRIANLLPNEENQRVIDGILRPYCTENSDKVLTDGIVSMASLELQSKLFVDKWEEVLPNEPLGGTEIHSSLTVLITMIYNDFDTSNWSKTIEALEISLKNHIGAPAERLFASWRTTTDADIVMTELLRFIQVWQWYGREKTLSLIKDWGLTSFQSIPTVLLNSQTFFSENGDVGKGIIVFMMPFSDYNGALRGIGPVLENLYYDVSKTHNIVLAQVKHRYEILRYLSRVRKKYGSEANNHQADYIILAVHGNVDKMSFGDGGKDTIDINLLNDFGRTDSADSILKTDGEIILISCSTGAENGIAEVITNKYNRTTHSPAKPTNIDDLLVEYNKDGKLIIRPEYSDADEVMTRVPKTH